MEEPTWKTACALPHVIVTTINEYESQGYQLRYIIPTYVLLKNEGRVDAIFIAARKRSALSKLLHYLGLVS